MSQVLKRFTWIGGCVLAAVLTGLIIGAPVSLVALLLSDAAMEQWQRGPGAWLLHGVAMSVVLCVLTCFFLGVQMDFISRRFQASRPERGRPTRIVLWSLLSTMGLAGILIGSLAIGARPGEPVVARMAVAAAVIGMILGHAISVSDNSELRQREFIELRAQMKTLQAQISPHFFFNTLNSISSLIPEDPPAAQRTIGLLADMSRYSFSGMQSEFAPLADELKFARDYLDIERVRFGDRLRFELPEATDVERIRVPAFTLQPLVENAIRHGISKLVEGGSVSVRVRKEDMQFELTVENDIEPGSAPAAEDFFKAGHALENVRRRIRFYYPPRAEHQGWWRRQKGEGPTRIRMEQGSVAVSFPRPDRVAITIKAGRASLYDGQLLHRR